MFTYIDLDWSQPWTKKLLVVVGNSQHRLIIGQSAENKVSVRTHPKYDIYINFPLLFAPAKAQ